MVRSAALSGYAELARSLGLEPQALAREAGVPWRALSSPDVLVRAKASYRLLELSAQRSGVPDLGLQLALPRGLSHLGVLGLLARDEHTVRLALRRIMTNLTLHSTCIAMDLREEGDLGLMTLRLLPDGEPVIRQSTEAAMGLLMQILTHLLGTQWHPLRVQFVHPAGASSRIYRQYFGCAVAFGQEFNALVLPRGDLDHPMPGADGGFRRFTPDTVKLSTASPRLSTETVRQTIIQLLPNASCNSTLVAQHMGVHRRTLHRHLAAQGSDFRSLLHALRLELAQDYLRAGTLGISDIALLLGFNSVSACSRWFSAQTGIAPTRWQREQGAPGLPSS